MLSILPIVRLEPIPCCTGQVAKDPGEMEKYNAGPIIELNKKAVALNVKNM